MSMDYLDEKFARIVSREFPELLERYFQRAFALAWREHIQPGSANMAGGENLEAEFLEEFSSNVENQLRADIGEEALEAEIVIPLRNAKAGMKMALETEGPFQEIAEMGLKDDFLEQLNGLGGIADSEIEALGTSVLRPATAGVVNAAKAVVKRTANLAPLLIHSVRDIHSEYLFWLQKHPDSLDRIAWEAFEKIIAEILQSQGFHVELTGRSRNESMDVFAIRTDELGIDTRYLIECKRYSKDRRVGLDIVNQVIGAKQRAGVDHALLVTTSTFTQDVQRLENQFRDHRLHLRDGATVVEWLQDYKPREDGGLWLPKGWNLDEDQ